MFYIVMIRQYVIFGVLSGYSTIIYFAMTIIAGIKFQLLITAKMLKSKTFLTFKLSEGVFIMLINVKMPTIVGILTFMGMINFMLN